MKIKSGTLTYFYKSLVFKVGVYKYKPENIFIINSEVKLSLFVLNSKTFVKTPYS